MRALFAWDLLPALIWSAALLRFAGPDFGGATTGGLLEPVLTWLLGPLPTATFETLHLLVRKLGHICGYGVLGFLWLRPWRGWHHRQAATAVLLTAAIAATDEWLQTRTPVRHGTAGDVLLDTAAAALAVLIARRYCATARTDVQKQMR